MSWETISWILVAISLVGNVFVIKKNVIGQWMWAASNIGLICYNLHVGATAQVFLFSAYLLMCLWGILAWSKKSEKTEAKAA